MGGAVFYGEAVRQYIYGNEEGKTIAKSIGVHPSLLHQWIKQFEPFGDDAFEKRYTPYPAQFKLVCGQDYTKYFR
ncbi:transposase [Peribacillus sp. NPDC096540]|uniref:transposase n=1 Tax=Peribacillus sp. NPDC096540 TaxID=3390612 RepID=UPI003D067C30